MKIGHILQAYGLLIGVVSAIFMLFVFFNEAFLKRGVLYIEPNLAIATLEFFMGVLGLAILIIEMTSSVYSLPDRTPPKHVHRKEGEERIGYETNNDRAYQ